MYTPTSSSEHDIMQITKIYMIPCEQEVAETPYKRALSRDYSRGRISLGIIYD